MVSLMSMKRTLSRYPLASALVLAIWRAVKYPSQLLAGEVLRRAILALIPDRGGMIWYFGRPTHPNLGDQAQALYIGDWMRTHYPDKTIVEIPTWAFFRSPRRILGAIDKRLEDSDLFVMQSGYTMNDGNPDEVAHRLVPSHYPRHRVLFMPQTISYKDPSWRKRTVEALCGCENVLLLCRDEVSCTTALELFEGPRIELFPDIVTTRIGREAYNVERSGVLFCIRDDMEKLFEESAIDQLAEELEDVHPVDRTDTSFASAEIEWRDAEQVRSLLGRIYAEYSRYETIVTDRYHGMIFSLIAGTPVVVLPTTDHKVVAGVRWFKGVADDYVRVANRLEEVPELVAELRPMTQRKPIGPIFLSNYYERLPELLMELSLGGKK